ncbi:C45 family autoproteolytic acyltransferase/hydrolase [Alloiococcus sp. CFN-8]|uniref:C45 family autoproteolytic acyltransferase/hydolase n=1 Tax=Alloiococcus sp. CFN-8 TaxID=3416081 RepID=UPI003CE84DC1
MYKLNFTGDPYKAGYKYGLLSYKRNIRIKDILDFSEEIYSLDKDVMAIYKEYYPEVLEEIKGISEGQKLSYKSLAGYILSSTPSSLGDKSFCFAMIDRNNIILGRNCNLETTSNEIHKSCFYNLHGGYSFIGNTYSLVQMGDGINEWGLSVGLSPIASKASKPGLNGGMVVRYLLEKCRNTYEAVEMLKKLPIAYKIGLIIVDGAGDCILAEISGDKVSVRSTDNNSPFLLSANIFNNQPMRKYRSRGAEALIMQNRYLELEKILKNSDGYVQDLPFNFLLEAQDFMEDFVKDKSYKTLWSAIYDLKNFKIYRTEGKSIKNNYKQDFRFNGLHNSTKLYKYNEKL